MREPGRAALACSARPGLARLDPVYLGDDLYACQPVCEAVRAQGGHFLFVCKPSSHPTIQEYLTGIDLPEHVERVKRGKQRFTHRYRWLYEVPLRGDAKALTVNWLQIEILDATGEVTYRNSFVTDLPVDAGSVAELAACGRARWKIENESFNVLKTKGYHLEHNFGHGKEHLRRCWPASTCWRLRSTPSAISPTAPGARPARRLGRARASSRPCRP